LDDPNGVYLPVRLEGKPPFDLNYTLINEDKLIVDKSIWNQNALLKVYKPGVYELRGIHDKYCPGVVENPRQFEGKLKLLYFLLYIYLYIYIYIYWKFK